MVQSRRLTALSDLPVTLEELRLHCHVDDTAEDDALEGFIVAASELVERRIWRAVATSDWVCTFEAFPAGVIKVPFGPVAVISGLTYVDANGVSQDLATDAWRLAGEAIEPLQDWPDTDVRAEAVTLSWTAAPDDAGCPETIKLAIKMLAGWWFKQREAGAPQSMSAVPWGVEMILRSHRNFA